LAKLQARAWLSHALSAPGQHTAKNEEKQQHCGRHYAADVLTDLIAAALHENTGAAVCAGKNKCARLETTSGVRQGCILAPALFCVAIDWILNHMTVRPSRQLIIQ